jgi:integrase
MRGHRFASQDLDGPSGLRQERAHANGATQLRRANGAGPVKADGYGDVVFGSGYIGKAFRKACATAGIKGVTPHTLRHTFASRLVMSGADLRTVQELGGWQTIAMVERYSHLSREHKANAIERLAEFPYAMPTDQAERITLRRPTLS